jgi:phospholipid N-methyltransferase
MGANVGSTTQQINRQMEANVDSTTQQINRLMGPSDGSTTQQINKSTDNRLQITDHRIEFLTTNHQSADAGRQFFF